MRHFLENQGEDTVVVGWDPPVQSFFAQIYFAGRAVDEADTPHAYCGYLPQEIATPDELDGWLAGHGFRLTPELREVLLQEQFLNR